jgi:hypothetical protein
VRDSDHRTGAPAPSRADPRARVVPEGESACAGPTWSPGPGRRVGTRCAHGRRPVAAALRRLGVPEAPPGRRSPDGLNRARWAPLAASPPRSGAASGWRWIGWPRMITPPWTQRPGALPVWSGPAPPPAVSQRVARWHKTGPDRRTAWYDTSPAMFTAVVAAGRRHGWGGSRSSTSAHAPPVGDIPGSALDRLAHAVCDAP